MICLDQGISIPFDERRGVRSELRPGLTTSANDLAHEGHCDTPTEGGPRSGAGLTYDFYRDVFECNSIEIAACGSIPPSTNGKDYDNAFWNGREMVYGDGNLFRRFTVSIDVIGHELTQGVTGAEAELDYEGESGSLNEHSSDVFGSLLKQWHRKQKGRGRGPSRSPARPTTTRCLAKTPSPPT
jgi:hypothetical protein